MRDAAHLPDGLIFPPLMSGEASPAPGGAMAHAVRRARDGCDAGLVSYAIDAQTVQVALVFAPEVPLRQAMVMLPLCAVGVQNALGALAPPELAVHLEWQGGIRVNGARCGQIEAVSATRDPDAVPDWLVVGWQIPLVPETEDTGLTPDQTTLRCEGCGDLSPALLIEAWARHTLNWITRWEDGGAAPVHTEWRGLVHGIGDAVAHHEITGTFLGVDEDFGMLIKTDRTTELVPLTSLLKETGQ